MSRKGAFLGLQSCCLRDYSLTIIATKLEIRDSQNLAKLELGGKLRDWSLSS